ncbi:MAG: hypothetical protein WAM79_02150 [Candidatus Sulfotelmatobacter sp.]
MDQIQLETIRRDMIERAIEAIQRSDALLARTREVLRQAETLVAKHASRKATPALPKRGHHF